MTHTDTHTHTHMDTHTHTDTPTDTHIWIHTYTNTRIHTNSRIHITNIIYTCHSGHYTKQHRSHSYYIKQYEQYELILITSINIREHTKSALSMLIANSNVKPTTNTITVTS